MIFFLDMKMHKESPLRRSQEKALSFLRRKQHRKQWLAVALASSNIVVASSQLLSLAPNPRSLIFLVRTSTVYIDRNTVSSV